ncbi:VTT domain-containing protein [Hamadaea flava]|uniref:VTT domain-containing protein n=1 Tax=Hamadaea flava TaxID=1742688 RepID=UPI0020A32B0D|nr:VTT domain-containing protein [Hamadaea flava]
MSQLASTTSGVLDPTQLISAFGLIGIMVIVFAESGLLVGFFLPGDSLLFTAGLLVASDRYLHYPLWVVIAAICVAAIIGDQVGYLFGRKVGPGLFRKPDARLFKQRYLTQAQHFFDHHGARSIVLARFVPLVRTFAPIVAGTAEMRYRTFVLYNIAGGVAWGTVVTVAGYFLGQLPVVANNIEVILVAIVAVSFVPVAIELLRGRRRARKTAAGSKPADGPAADTPQP